jgi:hypothetical protein
MPDRRQHAGIVGVTDQASQVPDLGLACGDGLLLEAARFADAPEFGVPVDERAEVDAGRPADEATAPETERAPLPPVVRAISPLRSSSRSASLTARLHKSSCSAVPLTRSQTAQMRPAK